MKLYGVSANKPPKGAVQITPGKWMLILSFGGLLADTLYNYLTSLDISRNK